MARPRRPGQRLVLLLLIIPVLTWARAPDTRDYFVHSQSVTLPGGDEADVYAPDIPRGLRGKYADAFPVIAFLQGALVDKSNYSSFAHRLAQRGFIVVIPNHYRPYLPFYPDPVLLAEVNVVTEVLEQMSVEDVDPHSPLYQIVDTERLAVFGHSFGGSAAIDAAAGACNTGLCQGDFSRPEALKAVVVYGSSRLDPHTNEPIDQDTSGVAVALLQGTQDSVADPVKADLTFPTLERPHALINIEGANHYGICNENNPQGARPDLDASELGLSQHEALDQIADWTLGWLQGHLRAGSSDH